jgi:hypothetical protein
MHPSFPWIMEATVSRSTPLLRTALGAAVLGSALLLSGCFAPPVPVVTETPKPEPDFGSIGGDTPVPIETSIPVETSAPSEDGFVSVYDDLGVVKVAVPEDWSDVTGEGFTTDAGQDWAFVAAAEDLDGYLESWSVAGVEVGATSISGVDEATLDAQLLGLLESVSAAYAECGTMTADAQRYDDGFFVGYESLYEECGIDGTVGFAITAASLDGTQVVFVRGQITSAYDVNTVYSAITGSFDTSIGRAAGADKN